MLVRSILVSVLAMSAAALGQATQEAPADDSAVVTGVAPQGDAVAVTISKGTAAGVEKGMHFIIMRGNERLGVMTVDIVDAAEAVGRATGPKVNTIRKGDRALRLKPTPGLPMHSD